nr:hypothetical protein [Candidatus Sigynarchaeum springense]
MPLGTLEALGGSEFFSFFNVHETKRHGGAGDGVRVVECKPGGFQEYIDMSFDVNAGGDVVVARLLLDRSWIGSGEHVNPFANDIAKSFIDALVPPGDHAAIEPLLRAIMDAKGTSDKRIYLHDQPRDLTPDLDTIKALGVYLEAIPKHEISMGHCHLRIENIVVEGRGRLEIVVRST